MSNTIISRPAVGVVSAKPFTHGQGFTAYSVGQQQLGTKIAPFLQLDHYFMSQPTFAEHPHQGFSAVTYMFEDSEGSFFNEDSQGDRSTIAPGDLHWTQAGSGIRHNETPIEPGKMCHGIQMFVDLPLADKSLPAKAFHLSAAQIPVYTMAPMTRLRATNAIPTALMVEYYAQRASAGLIVTECTMVSPMSNGYVNCPGIYSAAQVTAWQQVTDAVHQKGGKIFLQLWHSGRISHPSLLNGELPVAPSAIAAIGTLHSAAGKVTLDTPRALATDEIPQIVEQFRQGAKNALQAGFDGVELHGAFGYLIDQFLQDGSNQRTDRYGGSIENRTRFLLEVVEAVCEVWGGERVGIKLSPSNTFYGMYDSNPLATFSYAIAQLDRFKLAYIHLMEPNEEDLQHGVAIDAVLSTFRPFYSGAIVTNGGYDKSKGNRILEAGTANLVSFGKPFIANPDLVERLAIDAPLNDVDFANIYGKGDLNLDRGYTDYPFLNP